MLCSDFGKGEWSLKALLLILLFSCVLGENPVGGCFCSSVVLSIQNQGGHGFDVQKRIKKRKTKEVLYGMQSFWLPWSSCLSFCVTRVSTEFRGRRFIARQIEQKKKEGEMYFISLFPIASTQHSKANVTPDFPFVSFLVSMPFNAPQVSLLMTENESYLQERGRKVPLH